MADQQEKSPERRKRRVQLQIQLDEDMSHGTYCNLAMINHNETEFILDFMFVQPQQPKAKVRARVLLSPKTAKRLIAAMQHNIELYERKFGVIALPKPSGSDLSGPEGDDSLYH